MPVDESAEVPFSVQIGFMNPEDVRRNEPLMPRSAGIGRLSKRALPKFMVKDTSQEVVQVKLRSAASNRAAAVADPDSGKSKRLKAVASAKKDSTSDDE
jgi:hypothetical protein